MGQLFAIFATVFLAELGDKTQLATLLFASQGKHSPWLVFAASAGALVCSSALAVIVGHIAARRLETIPLGLIAGIGFVVLGVWSIVEWARG
jgi:putative Ca2+/H+ antiporter (TMEM165/GDT1 family)